MADRSGFAIGVTVQDQASARLDAINRRIAGMQAPSERFNKSLAKFGDVTGLARAAEGVQALGDRALGAARAVERLATPLAGIAALTGAGGIAGIAAFSRQWAEAGNQISKASYLLSAPVERVSALRGAARLAGSSAEAMDTSLQGLNDTIHGAAFRRNPEAVKLFDQLHVRFETFPGAARNVLDVLRDVAERINGMPSHAQGTILKGLGLSPDLLPLLDGGGRKLDGFTERARATGGVMTGEMARNASALRTSFEALGLSIEGVANRLEDKYGKAAQHEIDRVAKWIENNKALADSYVEIGTSVAGAFALWKAAGYLPWMVRALGLAAAGEEMLYYGTRIGQTAPPKIDEAHPGQNPSDRQLEAAGALPPRAHSLGDWWSQTMPSWLGGGPSAPAIKVPLAPTAAAANMERVRAFFTGKGLTDAQTAGILANVAAESGFDPAAVGDGGTSYGLFQYHAGRRSGLFAKYGPRPTLDQQLDYAWDELNGPERTVLDRLRQVRTPDQSGAVFTGFERPANGPAEAWNRGKAADQFMPHPGGAVQVDVTVRGLPTGSSASVTQQGAVQARPPRVETAMPAAR